MNLKHSSKADGYLARRFKMQTVLGTILDPAADKTLMTTLTVTLAMQGLLPGMYIISFLRATLMLHIYQYPSLSSSSDGMFC